MSRASSIFSIPVPTIKNHEAYPAYERSFEEQYLQMLLTNTFGNTFYANSNELLIQANDLHDKMLAIDPEFAAKALCFAREEGHMRLQPIFGLAKLSAVNKRLFSKEFKNVIRIPSDLQDFMVIIKGQGRGEGGRVIKREVCEFLNSVSEYWALKYNGRGREYSLGDIVATTHPKAITEKQNAIFRYLIGKDYPAKLVPQIHSFELLKKADSTKEMIKLITEGRLPHEIVTGAVKPNREIWQSILYQMPAFALLRNLNTLSRAGVLDNNREYITQRLTDRQALAKSKILPFRFLNAFENVESNWVKDVLRESVELTFNNLPEIPGQTAIFLDISGSMGMSINKETSLKTGAIFALSLFKKTKGNGVFWLFNTNVHDPKASLHDSILTQAEKIRATGGTDTGKPVFMLTTRGIKVDNIIMITDEQQNSGNLFYRCLNDYKQQMNKDVKTFIIDLSPYHSAMVPPTDKNTWYIYGWSDIVLQYISTICNDIGGMVEKVKSIP